LLIHDLIKPREFNCVAAVTRGIYQICGGICQIFPRKTVGPTHLFIRYENSYGTPARFNILTVHTQKIWFSTL